MRKSRIHWGRLLIVLLAGLGVCLLALLLLSAAGPYLRRVLRSVFWSADPDYAAQVAQQLLDFDLPAGYQYLQASKDENIPIVVLYNPARPSELISIMREQVADPTDPQEIRSMEIVWGRDVGDQRYRTQRVGSATVNLRGAPFEVSIWEGQDSSGAAVRQVIAYLSGKQGDIVIVIVGSLSTWDQTLVEQFFASIR